MLSSSAAAINPVLVADCSVTIYTLGPVLVSVPSGLIWSYSAMAQHSCLETSKTHFNRRTFLAFKERDNFVLVLTGMCKPIGE